MSKVDKTPDSSEEAKTDTDLSPVLDAEGRPIQPLGEATVAVEPTKLDDTLTDKAINEIVAREGDEVLEHEDQKREDAEVTKKPAKKGKLRDWFKRTWAKPAGKWSIIGGSVALLLAVALIPASRYFVLNNVGIRSSLTVTVLDGSTLQPLKNVQVSAAGVTGQTGSNGEVKLEHLKLGSTNLTIDKRAFASIKKPIVIGWGSNPLGKFRVSAVGAQYVFIIQDFLSGKPIEKAELSSGEGNAVADKDGKVTLTLDNNGKTDDEILVISVSAENYRTETIETKVGSKDSQKVKLVPARKHVFVSKRSGKYDIYTIDVDGKNEKKIISATGLERDNLALLPGNSGDRAALVASRENVRNKDGYLLTTLYQVDTKTGSLTKIDQSEDIRLVGWSSEDRLAYVKVAAGASAGNPKRYRLMSYNGKTASDQKELASSNYFNDVLMISNRLYYSLSDNYDDTATLGFYSLQFDGSAATKISEKEIWDVYRTAYDTLQLDASGDYITYKVGSSPPSLTSNTTTPALEDRDYTDSLDGKASLWVDQRDGKDLLLIFDKTANKDTTLLSKKGLKQPLYWLTATVVVVRVSDGKEVADYILDIRGGEARKILDVSDTKGIELYY